MIDGWAVFCHDHGTPLCGITPKKVNVYTGLVAAQVDPPSGSVIANFEGTLNATTLTCNVTAPQIGSQVITSWSVRNFRGVTEQGFVRTLAPELFLLGGHPIPAGVPDGVTYDNQMTILNLTSELDRVVLLCALQEEILANFTLRVYRKIIYLVCV